MKKLFFVLLFISSIIFAQIKIGEEKKYYLQSPHPYPTNGLKNEPVMTEYIYHPDASLIKIHFSKFSLSEGHYLIIKSPDGKYSYKYEKEGPLGTGEFYASYILGDMVIIELYTPDWKEGFGFEIDSYYWGYKNLSYWEETPSPESVCGSTDWKNAKCYSGTVYDKAKTVTRYIYVKNPYLYACTGWLVGCEGHVLSNNHCISSQNVLNSADFEFMAEGSNCNTNCDDWGLCPGPVWSGTKTLVATSSQLDYSLYLLGSNPQNTYGYLQARNGNPVVGEQIYIPEHPNAWGKKISYDSDMDSGGRCKVSNLNNNGCATSAPGLHYYCDTAGGSSGSPVISVSDYYVVGLHNCGGCLNSGVQIDNIGADLQSKGVLPDGFWAGTSCGGGCTPPSAPTGLSITGNCNSVSLSWTGSGATGYNIYRKTGTCGGTYTQIASGITTTTYNDTGVVAGSTYAYVVRGYSQDIACESADSNCVSTTVQSSPSTPAAPTITDDCTGLQVSWSASTGATSYNVYRRTGGCGNNGWSQVATGITSTSWTDTNASLGSTYGYYIEAVNSCGTATNGKNACGSGTHNLTTPSAPTNLVATGTCTSIDLTWNSSTGATSYNILRTTNSNCSTGLTQIGTSSNTSYSDTTAVAGTTYYYVVQAVNSCGTSSNSNCANSARLSIPSAPSITNITDESNCAQSGIRVYYNSGSGATSHSLYKDGSLAQSNYISGNLYNPQDTNSHSYFIRATNSCGDADSTSQNFTDTNNSTTPTITGPSSNTCPSNSVLLSTESGMSNYQWYLNGNPIAGANTYQYTATQSGNLTVSYTNTFGCNSTSNPFSVTINPCIPNIVYYSNSGLIAVNEDGDGIPEAGEKWQLTVTVINNGEAPATNVYGNLAGEGITLCNTPGYFGNLNINQTSSYNFIFVIDSNLWYSTYSCGSSIGFDLVNKSSDGGTYNYADDLNFLIQQVGQLGGTTTENSIAPNISNVKNRSKTSTFSPSFTLTPNVDNATVSFTLTGTTDLTNCVLVELLAPNSSVLSLKNYGETAQNSYNVTSFYNTNGAGTYTLQVTEASGCSAPNEYVNCSSISMSVSKTTGSNNCDTSSFSCLNIAGEVSDDSLHHLKVLKNGTNINLQFEDIGAQYYNIYVSNNPNTHSFLVSFSTDGKKECHITIDNDLGEMLEVLNYNLESGITGDTSKLFILISADNGPSTEGSLGKDSNLSSRTADSYCNR